MVDEILGGQPCEGLPAGKPPHSGGLLYCLRPRRASIDEAAENPVVEGAFSLSESRRALSPPPLGRDARSAERRRQLFRGRRREVDDGNTKMLRMGSAVVGHSAAETAVESAAMLSCQEPFHATGPLRPTTNVVPRLTTA